MHALLTLSVQNISCYVLTFRECILAIIIIVQHSVLVPNMQHMQSASKISQRSPPWNGSDVSDLDNALFQVSIRLQAICNLQEEAPRLKLWGFLSESTRTRIIKVINQDFAARRQKLLNQANATITQQVRNSAKAAAVQAAVNLVKPDVVSRSKSEVQGKYIDGAKQMASTDAKNAAKRVCAHYKGKIIGESFIPFAGPILAQKLTSEMKHRAKDAAISAAKAAVNSYMASPEVRAGIQGIVKSQTSQVLQAKKQQVSAAMKSAAGNVIKQALKNLHK